MNVNNNSTGEIRRNERDDENNDNNNSTEEMGKNESDDEDNDNNNSTTFKKMKCFL